MARGARVNLGPDTLELLNLVHGDDTAALRLTFTAAGAPWTPSTAQLVVYKPSAPATPVVTVDGAVMAGLVDFDLSTVTALAAGSWAGHFVFNGRSAIKGPIEIRQPGDGAGMVGALGPAAVTVVDGTTTVAVSVQGATVSGGGGGGGATNLGYTASATNGTVTSSTGAPATIPLATGTNAGLMGPAQVTKLAGIESGATADQTAAEILAALLTVDGAGSGLDADTLDGISSAGFAAAGHLHTGVYDPAGTAASAVAAHEAAADPHPTYTTAAEAAAAATAAVGTHEAAGDPHPQYTTAGEASAAAGAAVSTHEGAVDPHPQYTTAAEAAAAAPVQSVAGRTGVVTLAAADVSGLGNSASRNVGTTTGTVAAGDDTRLSDARTPTAHAATHNAGGPDQLSLTSIAVAADVTTHNATTGRPGLAPKLPGGTTTFYRADGTFAAPAGGGGIAAGPRSIWELDALATGTAVHFPLGFPASPVAAAAGDEYWIPMEVPRTFDASGLAINCTTVGAGSIARISFYAAASGLPAALIEDNGTVDTATSTGVKIASFAATRTVTGGHYYARVLVTGGAPTLSCASATATAVPWWLPMPSAFSAIGGSLSSGLRRTGQSPGPAPSPAPTLGVADVNRFMPIVALIAA